MSTITVNTVDTKKLIEKQVLELINKVYFYGQERYTKLSKKGQLALDKLIDADSDTEDRLIINVKNYKKESFNDVFPDLTEKEQNAIIERADLILDYVKFMDIEINTRAYNLLRHLVSNF